MLLSILLFNFQHGLLLWYSCWTQEFLVSNCSGNLILNNLVGQRRKAGGSQAAEVSPMPWHAVLIIALLQFAVHRNQGIYESLKGAGDREVIIIALREITQELSGKKKKLQRSHHWLNINAVVKWCGSWGCRCAKFSSSLEPHTEHLHISYTQLLLHKSVQGVKKMWSTVAIKTHCGYVKILGWSWWKQEFVNNKWFYANSLIFFSFAQNLSVY